MKYIVRNDKVIHPITGEIVANLVSYQKLQKRIARQNLTMAERRAAAHFAKAMGALAWCLGLAILIAFVACNYRVLHG
jgi:hypothetical protein